MGLKNISRLLCTTAFCIGSVPILASPIVWDWSPQTTGGTVTSNSWGNYSSGQHFAEHVSFSAVTDITGMDIYSVYDSPNGVGSSVLITIWADSSGLPGSVLGQFSVAISEVDALGAITGNTRKHADFAGFMMLANTPYWIGMTSGPGAFISLGQTALLNVAGGDSRMAQFNNNSFQSLTNRRVGDMAFRLYGNQNGAVPEPATLALLGFGLAGVGYQRRNRLKT